MGSAMLLVSGIAMVVWRPCRNLEGRAPLAAVGLLLLSVASIWFGSFAIVVQIAAHDSSGAWTACGVLWQQILNGQVHWLRLVPLAAWLGAFGARGAVALGMQQLALWRFTRGLIHQGSPLPGSGGALVVPHLGTPAVAVGVLRPRVVVDRDFWNRATRVERQVVLAHEGAHARGGHAVVEAATTLLLGPLLPLAAAADVYECVRRHLEAIADDAAVRTYGRETVGHALGNVALEAFPAAGLGVTGACVWRVERLLAPRRSRVSRDRYVMAGMVLMMAVMLVGPAAETASALGPVSTADFCPVAS